MALTKDVSIDLVQIVMATKDVQVRQVKKVLDDGEVIAEQYHRYVLRQGDDISGQPAAVRAICNLVWK